MIKGNNQSSAHIEIQEKEERNQQKEGFSTGKSKAYDRKDNKQKYTYIHLEFPGGCAGVAQNIPMVQRVDSPEEGFPEGISQ